MSAYAEAVSAPAPPAPAQQLTPAVEARGAAARLGGRTVWQDLDLTPDPVGRR